MKKRYYELVKAVHPDKMRHTKKAADEFTKRINTAKETIAPSPLFQKIY